jgi:hypothetical protein
MKISIALMCALIGGAAVAGIAASNAGPTDGGHTSAASAALIDRFLDSGQPPLASYTARRVLTASALDGRVSASLQAWTSLDEDGRFRFEIVQQHGSGLIRKRVLIAALKAEQRSRAAGQVGQADLTPKNYDFQVAEGERADRLAVIYLLPRRKAPMLLNGMLTVKEQDGDVVRIDGNPSQPPSWWTKRVDIVRRYARIAGVRVPVEMTSRADVRMAGEATFSMTYDYDIINGRAITGEARAGR